MQKEYVTTMSDYGKTAIDATKELVEINGRLMSKMLESQISLANAFVESSEKQISTAAISDPKEYVQQQTALFEEYAAKLTEAAQANAALAQEAGEELKTWFEKGVKSADEAVKDAAEKAAASAPVAPAKKAAPKKPAAKKAPAKKAPAAKATPKADEQKPAE